MSIASIVEWFSEAPNALAFSQLAAAGVTAVATIALWRVTRTLAVETKVLARMTAQPFIVCALESSQAAATALDLVIRNTGNATAFDVRLELTPALPHYDGDEDEGVEHSVIVVSLIPPGNALPRRGVLSPDVYDKVYNVNISWATSPGGKARETLSYKLGAEDGFRGGWGAKGIHHVAQELEKIRNQIAKEQK